MFASRILVVAALALHSGLAQAEYAPNALRAKAISAINVVLSAPGSLTVMGTITPATLTSFRRLAERDLSLQRVYIDSAGGDVRSAMDIARIIAERHLTLLVDGR